MSSLIFLDDDEGTISFSSVNNSDGDVTLTGTTNGRRAIDGNFQGTARNGKSICVLLRCKYEV